SDVCSSDLMDQSPLTSTQLAPRSVESARLKLSLKLVTTGHLPDQAATGTLRTRLPEVSVNVSPEVTAFAVMVPDPPKEPAVDAVHSEKWVKSSLPATDVQVTSALDAFDALLADAQVGCLRVVSVAAFDVPAAPGSPT